MDSKHHENARLDAARRLLESRREANSGRVALPRGADSFLEALRRELAPRRPKRPFARPTRLQRLEKAWQQAVTAMVGEAAAKASAVRAWRNGRLDVAAQSAALAHQLGVFQRAELLERLNALLPKGDRVVDLSVRARPASWPTST